MSTIAELHDGFTSSLDAVNVKYLLLDQTDGPTALANLRSFAPSTYDGLPREDVTVAEITRAEGKLGAYYGTAKYRRPGSNASKGVTPLPTGSTEYAFEQNLVNVQEYMSLQTIDEVSSLGSTPTDVIPFHKYLDVDRKTGFAKGTNVRRPVGGFSLSFFASASLVDEAYKVKVCQAVGKVSSTSFNGYAAGEVLFVGVAGRLRSDEDWDIQMRFETQPNQTNVVISPTITLPAVEGWDYVWVYYDNRPATLAESPAIVPDPFQANVERIYERYDLNQLFVVP